MAGDSSVPGQVVGDGPAGERPGDAMLRRMYGAHMGTPAPSRGTLHIQFENAPAGMTPRASMDDLFKEVIVSKQRQLAPQTRT